MEPDFWLQRWQNQQIGFHLNAPHPLLQKYHEQCFPERNVLVPLCGKSLDMEFLATMGHKVIGVELSELAVSQFFSERELSPSVSSNGTLKQFEAADYCLYQGDFFDLDEAAVGATTHVYDRAALIALPSAMRRQYVAHIEKILPRPVSILLITLDYDQSAMQGPPFAVSEQEVADLYGQATSITQLRYTSIIEQDPGFKEQGLDDIFQAVYHIQY